MDKPTLDWLEAALGRRPRQPALFERALIAFYSTDGSAEWLKPWTWPGAARWERVGKTF